MITDILLQYLISALLVEGWPLVEEGRLNFPKRVASFKVHLRSYFHCTNILCKTEDAYREKNVHLFLDHNNLNDTGSPSGKMSCCLNKKD